MKDYSYYFIDNVLLSPLPESAEPGHTSFTYCGGAPPIQIGTNSLPPQIGNITYAWTAVPADPNFDHTVAQPVVQPTGNTVYHLTVTIVFTDNGTTTTQTFSSVNSATVTITPPTAGPAQTTCSTPVTLQVLCPVSGATYVWTSTTGEPTITTTASTVPVLPAATTTYILSGVLSNGQALTVGNANTTTVTVTPATAGPNQAIGPCGGTATLTVLCPNPAATYTWTAPGGFTATGASVPVTPTTTTTYDLNYQLNGGPFHYAGGTTTVTVSYASIGSPQVQNVDCGQTAQLVVANPCPAATYTWTPTWTLPGGVGMTGPSVTGTSITVTPPYPTTTYTLTATLNGVALPIEFPNVVTVTVNNGQCCTTYAYKNNGNYANPVPGGASYELGDPTGATVTTISGTAYSGGACTFAGVYHVRGPVVFEKGNFTVKKGTIFYVDGGNNNSPLYPAYQNSTPCYGDVLGRVHHFLQIYVGKGASLTLDGATFTAACDRMWGGVELVENGQLFTKPGSAIKEARIGVLSGTECQATDARYNLLGTTFYNDTYGVVVQGNAKINNPKDRTITKCQFYSNHKYRLWPDGQAATNGDYTQTGLVLDGDWHDGIAYTGNTFHDCYNGLEVAPGANGRDGVTISQNSFSRNYNAAIVVGYNTGSLAGPASAVIIADNSIIVPTAADPGGQVPAGTAANPLPVYGIEVLALPYGGQQLLLGTNDITSDSGPGHPGRTTIGLEGYLSFDYHRFSFQNQWTYLDIGVRILDGGSNTSQQDAISDNYFGFNDVGIELHGGMAAIPTPSIGCNTFEKNTTAINVDTSTPVQISGTDNGSGTTWEPAANAYNGNTLDVDNTQGSLTYFKYDPTQNPPPYATTGQAESVVFATPAGLYPILQGGTPCYARDEQLGVYGLNRPSAGSVTPAACQQWETQIRTTPWSDPATLLLTLRLIDYREQAGQLADLEAYANTLPMQNDPAFDRISLYLLERYRRLGQDSDAQRVRNYLLNQHGQDKNLAYRVQYFDVAGHLAMLAPGVHPTADDSTALAQVASSTADFAPVACATLRYFFPACDCQSTKPSRNSVARPAGSRPAIAAAMHKPVVVRAYPNPAREQVTLETIDLPAPVVQVQLVAATTGQVVYIQALANRELPRVPVAGLAPGLYQARLLGVAGQVVGTAKVAVLH